MSEHNFDTYKTIPLLAGWKFCESSRQNGISHYILMTPDGIAGSEEYHEDELRGLIEVRSDISTMFPALLLRHQEYAINVERGDEPFEEMGVLTKDTGAFLDTVLGEPSKKMKNFPGPC